jgi:hypothetical protein
MKQKKQVVLIVFSIILLLFIAGCGKGGDEISRDSPFLGGDVGLELKFLKDEPPLEITDGGIFPFRVVLSVINKGEFDFDYDDSDKLKQIRVDLKGILPSDFDHGTTNIVRIVKDDITNQNPITIPTPRKKDSEGNIIDAMETFVTIPSDKDLALGVDKIKGNTEFIFRADVCYQYGSDAIAKICILENMISVADDAICSPRGEKKVFSSSSPVKVTSLRQTVVGENRIQFSFDIEHTGHGKVFRNNRPISSDVGCPQNIADRRAEENLVYVEIATGLGDNTLNCPGFTNAATKSHKDVRLVDGKKTVTCTQDTDDLQADLERNIDIALRFNYLDSVQRKVLAKRLGGFESALISDTSGGIVVDGDGAGVGDGNSCDTVAQRELGRRCLSVSCDSDTLDPEISCDSTTECVCDSGEYSCVGDCTPLSGEDTIDPLISGGIQPHDAILDKRTVDGQEVIFPISQLFVILDVYDENGIKSCRIENLDDGTSFTDFERQGPALCDDASFPCDFTGVVSFKKTGLTTLKAICEDFNEREGTGTAQIEVREKIRENIPIITPDTTPPTIGGLVTNVVRVNVPATFVVVGVEDEKSGVQGCKFAVVDGNPNYQEVFPFATTTGIIRSMIPQGSEPCMGGREGADHGPCTFRIEHTFVSLTRELDTLSNSQSRGEGSVPIRIYCTNDGDSTVEEERSVPTSRIWIDVRE